MSLGTNALFVLVLLAGTLTLVAAWQTKHACAIAALPVWVVVAVLAWGPA